MIIMEGIEITEPQICLKIREMKIRESYNHFAIPTVCLITTISIISFINK